MTAGEMLLAGVLVFYAAVLLAFALALHIICKTLDASKPPARTYDQDLMDRQIAKLRRVASQTDATPSQSLCTGKCKQGRNCTCMPVAKGANP
jgi:hypothetical protein